MFALTPRPRLVIFSPISPTLELFDRRCWFRGSSPAAENRAVCRSLRPPATCAAVPWRERRSRVNSSSMSDFRQAAPPPLPIDSPGSSRARISLSSFAYPFELLRSASVRRLLHLRGCPYRFRRSRALIPAASSLSFALAAILQLSTQLPALKQFAAKGAIELFDSGRAAQTLPASASKTFRSGSESRRSSNSCEPAGTPRHSL